MAAEKKDKGDGLPEVDILMRGLLSQPGVEGFMVYNESGIPLKWTPSFVKTGTSSAASNPIPPSVVHYSSLLGDLASKSNATTRKLLGGDDGSLQLLRLRTKTNEIVIAPSDEATLVVVQKAHSAAMLPLVATEAPAAAPTPAAGTEEKKADKP